MTGAIRAVADHLRNAGVPFAVIDAVAMSARGFPRQTLDFDFLTTDTRILTEDFWAASAASPEIRRGEVDDPLLGVLRFRESMIDIIVGRGLWHSEAIARADDLIIGDQTLPVVRTVDLILLKLDAGGYRDAADIRMMLDGTSADEVEEIESFLSRLDSGARRLWTEIRQAE